MVWRYIIRSQSALWKKKKDYCIQGQGHSEGSKFNICPDIFETIQHFVFKLGCCDSSLWVGVSSKKIDLLFSRSRSLQELVWSKYDNFYCIFLIAVPFATKLSLVVHYHEQECFMEKLDCCGQGHSKISKCQWMSRWVIIKLGKVMRHNEPNYLSNRLVCCLQGQCHS